MTARAAADVRSEIADIKRLVPGWRKMALLRLIVEDMERLAARLEAHEEEERAEALERERRSFEENRSRGGPMTAEARRAGLEVLREVIRRHNPGFDVVFEIGSDLPQATTQGATP
jgi:hypothetical protein